MKTKKTALTVAILLLFSAGCASSLKVIIGKEKLVRIPQVVAHLEPALEKDKLLIVGKLVLQNPTESDLALGKITLNVQDESGTTLSEIKTDWQRDTIKSREFIQAPIKLSLPLDVLNRDLIQITLTTNLVYKKLAVQIPIQSKIAVIHLKAFKNSLSGALELVVNSRLRSDILGNASIEYSLDVSNPFNVDLQMEDANLKIYTKEKPDIVKAKLGETLLTPKNSTRIKGLIKLQKAFSAIIIREFLDGHAVRTSLTGNLRVPKTDIVLPFTVESSQEIDFSLFSNFK